MKQVVLWFLLVLIACLSQAQTEKISGIINTYSVVNDISGDTITVKSTSGVIPFDEILIIQMQGATIDESNSSKFGDILSLNNAGSYEFTNVCKVLNDSQILTQSIQRKYLASGNIQMITVPNYINAEIIAPLTARPWNGQTGGVLALKCSGSLTFASDINLQESGFRGGKTTTSSYSCTWVIAVDNYHYDISTGEGAEKGEGITTYITGKTGGRGAQANGGGGGNDHNSGGGGGANATTGGQGGRRIRSSVFKCRALTPGIGGKLNTYSNSLNNVFMGGGGGAGHEDNSNAATDGSRGGGIVFIKTDTLIGNGRTINVNGESITESSKDGSGGGGAAGTVVLDVNTYIKSINVEAIGADGGNVSNLTTENCNGPGGGGSGGVLWVNQTSIPANINLKNNAGKSGITLSSGQANCVIGGNNSAANGQDGITLTNLKLIEAKCDVPITKTEITVCNNDSALIFGKWRYASSLFYDTIRTGCCDSFFETKLTVLDKIESNFDAMICKGDTLKMNGTDYTFNVENAIEVFENVGPNNCDSTVVLNLIVIDIDTSVLVNDSLLVSGADDAEYQWIDCATNKPIVGADSQKYVAKQNGRYAVEINFNGCSAISPCHEVSNYDTITYTPQTSLKIYPNPTDGNLTIDLGQKYSRVYVVVTDMCGRFVQEEKYRDQQSLNLSLHDPAGTYVLWIDYDELRSVHKLIKY